MTTLNGAVNVCMFCGHAGFACHCGKPAMTVREWQRETGDEDGA